MQQRMCRRRRFAAHCEKKISESQRDIGKKIFLEAREKKDEGARLMEREIFTRSELKLTEK